MDGRAIYIPAVEEAIKRYLKAHGLTMQDMADRLGVSQQAISGAIRRGIGVNTAKRWSEVFGFNVEFLTTGSGNLLAGSDTTKPQQAQEPDTVPLLPIFAQAGSLTGWSEGIEEAKCERVISPVKDIDMAGRAYILDTVDGPVLKYLTPGADDGHVRCLSANHDPKFAPFEVLKEDILGMYKVVMCMKMM